MTQPLGRRDRRLPLTYWVIRRDEDGFLFPAKARGGVWTGPSYVPLDPSKHPPRLFNKRGHAGLALDRWLGGAWTKEGVRFSYELGVPAPAESVSQLTLQRRSHAYSIVHASLSLDYTCSRRAASK